MVTDYEFVKGLVDPYIKYYDIQNIHLVDVKYTNNWTTIYFRYTYSNNYIRYSSFQLPECIDPEAIKKVFEEANKYNVS